MNRANLGNVVTNGMQILSVAGTTAAGFERQSRQAHIADASSALNNLSEDELRQVGQMRADKLRADVSRYEAGGESPFQHLSDEEAGLYQAKRADEMRKFINKDSEEEENIDDIMSGTAFSTLKSPQEQAIRKYIENNMKYSKLYIHGEGGKFREATIEDIVKQKRGEDNDANV